MTAGPVWLSHPDCGLCFIRRLENRPDGWIPCVGPQTQQWLLGSPGPTRNRRRADMTSRAAPPAWAITYEEWLRRQIAQRGEICGPDVIDDRAWWQHLPGFNPDADLEAQLRVAYRQARAQAEAEAG